ncbi:alpha/beta fold hydrolase [Actinocrispum wychmicini]|uniref:Pimeloyl-ACP methyl ester carboxylesterase n=1 Tax=Actinocrispum wychmicini TaxID=1213861 RepID=A0A4R2JZ63_9PSEU|nr:alpha/beta hydrolase [Actinocrispum wychmicini]TCO62716.1 pimeloyl-ACP methyl ester carboxylesterase [Actinocrispum wychmicini]
MQVHHRYVKIQGHQVFYREAGPVDAPTVVLLHGFPTSSHMYRFLIPQLADRFHVVAPDYLGYGASDSPSVDEFEYSFASMASVIKDFLVELKIDRFALYIQDFGAPIGLRIATEHPEWVTAIVTQNGNAYFEGIGADYQPVLAGEPTEEHLRGAISAAATKGQYLDGEPDPSLVSPDSWLHDQTLLDRPGNDLIQFAMLRDYKTNVARYPQFHEYFRTSQVPLLAVWGNGDPIFVPAGASAFRTDLPDARIHLIDGGHFALEAHLDEIVALIRPFLSDSL